MDSSGWSKEKLTPIIINFHHRTMIGLAYEYLLDNTFSGEHRLFLVETEGPIILIARAAESSEYVKCFYPSDTAMWAYRFCRKFGMNILPTIPF